MGKIKVLVLAMILILSFSGCSDKITDNELKNFRNVEIPLGKKEIYNIFPSIGNSLGYEYNYIKNGRAKMKIPYPSSWKVSQDTSAHFILKSDESDPYMPGVTFHILYDYNNPAMAGGDPYSDYAFNVSDTISDFSDDIKKLEITVDSNKLSRNSNSLPDDQYFDGTLPPKYQNDILVGETDNIKTDQNLSDNGKTTQIFERNYYWNYQDVQCVFSFAGNQKYKESIKKLQDLMVKNTVYFSDGITNVGSFNPMEDKIGLTFDLPEQLKSVNISGTEEFSLHYQSGINSLSCLSGISVDLYDISDDINESNIDNAYAAEIFKYATMSKGLDTRASYFTEEISEDKIADLRANLFKTTCLINNDKSFYFRKGDTWIIDIYKIKKGKNINLLCITYPLLQEPMALEIKKLIKESATILK